MKTRFILPLTLLAFTQLLVAADPIPATSVKWMGHFGTSEIAPKTNFCLMARGFFQMPTSPEMPRLIAAWLQDHPKATVVQVASFGPITDKYPDSKMAYVWVIDGEHNLNIELVRQGCFAPETQTTAKGQKLDVAQADYDAFVRKALDAGKTAKAKKLGVWKASSE
jgi:hypothetical protein